jgi:Ca-activated chloride channel family protein
MGNKVLRVVFSIAGAVSLVVALSPSQQSQQAQSKPPAQTQQKKPDTQSAAGQEVDADDVIRINTTLVNSPVLVIGRNGRFIPSLRREDFEIFEDGVQQDITYFASVDKPFTVALLIDTSHSTALDLRDIQDAAISFVDKLHPRDRALIVSFSGEIKVLTEATSDPETLKNAIRRTRPEGNSRIYDAVSLVLTEKLDSNIGRTAVVLFSDGVDNDSRDATYKTSLEKIGHTQALIYPVQYNTYKGSDLKAPEGTGFSRKDYVRADSYLHRAAALSGTGVYPAQNLSDLEGAVARIVDELHNEYSIGYYPRNPIQPNENRKVEVRAKLSQLVVRARTSYALAPSGKVTRNSVAENLPTETLSGDIGALPITRSLDEAANSVDARWLCKQPDAPTDFVVVKEGFVSRCPKSSRKSDETNAWYIRRPGANETMCKGFMMWRNREVAGAPVPTGYVVTSAVTSPNCSKSGDPDNSTNAWLIRKPIGRETVCKGFPVPRGFVMEKETAVAGCPEKPGVLNGWIIRPK